MKPPKRIVELCERLTSPGHAPSKLSASEFSELTDYVFSLTDGPKVVCLCGSTRFWKTFQEQSLRLTKEGIIVLSIGCATASDEEHGITPEQKAVFDELHKRKIDLCDEVLVLNVGGYMGESTRSEIRYAEENDKPVRYLVPFDSAGSGRCG
jgi:hypothetical protein